MQAMQRITYPHPELRCVCNTVKASGVIFHKLSCGEKGVLSLVSTNILRCQRLHSYTRLVETRFDSFWYLNFLMNLAVVNAAFTDVK